MVKVVISGGAGDFVPFWVAETGEISRSGAIVAGVRGETGEVSVAESSPGVVGTGSSEIEVGSSAVVLLGSELLDVSLSEFVSPEVVRSGAGSSSIMSPGVVLSGVGPLGFLSSDAMPLGVTLSAATTGSGTKELAEKPSRRRFSSSATSIDETGVYGMKERPTLTVCHLQPLAKRVAHLSASNPRLRERQPGCGGISRRVTRSCKS